MFKYIILLSSCLFCISSNSQVQSPSEFLGYPIGSYFTRHHQVIDYFEQLESNNSANILLQQYGKTNENRDLIVAYISSEENLKKLDDIKNKHNGLSEEENVAIVWLSYNVHGNESAGTEAAMLTAYELITKYQELLKNVVVIIDPCLNPDGRDRYVNWYNAQLGNSLDPIAETKEHNEPWPSGRPNHYLFDLNRDWAWLTQLESQQRIKLYNDWLPHVHVDFHEQGIDEPYYFAPAAEPYHEIITKWQRAFQTAVGKNNAKYFDQNGWFYFTKEIFDLLYPSYGDTYPLYNGAVGMTYEQGGSGRAGLGVINEIGDTLSLYDRLIHHHTTGISTVEEANRQYLKLIEENHLFFNQQNFKYKSYVLSGNKDKLYRLTELLKAHQIEYSWGESGKIKGFDYIKNENGQHEITPNDLIISTQQKKGTLVNVLFEPKTSLSDSLTYDITAWSLPYAYGLNAIASEENLKGVEKINPVVINSADQEAYAYFAEWNSMKDARFLSALIKEGINVRFAENPFEIGGRSYERGTLIIAKGDNKESYDEQLVKIAYQYNIQLYQTSTGMVDRGNDLGASSVKLIKQPKVLVLTEDPASSLNVGEVWHFFDNDLCYPLSRINLNDLYRIKLNDYNVLILPDEWQGREFTDEQGLRISDWIKHGGKLITIGTAAANLPAIFESKITSKFSAHEESENEEDDKHEHPNISYNKQERAAIKNMITGAIVRCNVEVTNPLAFGYSDEYFTLKLSSNNYNWLDGGENVVYMEDKPEVIAGFVGSNARSSLSKSLVFGVERIGEGCIIHFADNPLFRGFWENGKLFMANALYFVGN